MIIDNFFYDIYLLPSGQSVNQSRVQQLTKLGNILSLVVKTSPKGDMAKIIWMLALTLIKY